METRNEQNIKTRHKDKVTSIFFLIRQLLHNAIQTGPLRRAMQFPTMLKAIFDHFSSD